MDITRYTEQLEQFRSALYQSLADRADTLLELVDAIGSFPEARSVVEYSLAPLFRRSYSMLSKALTSAGLEEMGLARLLAPYLPAPRGRDFWLLAADVTAQPRPYAQSVSDRSLVYAPTLIRGNKPVTIGHQYSSMVLLPEPEAGLSDSWVVPLMTRRVASAQDKEMSAAAQLAQLMAEPSLRFGRELTVIVGDSSYSKAPYLHAHRQYEKLVTISRVRADRVFYRRHLPTADEAAKVGHPQWYGAPFKLSDEQTWGTPDQQLRWQARTQGGKPYEVVVQAWGELCLRGKHKPHLPMHQYPFTLVRISRYDLAGQPLHHRSIWLLVMGAQRHDLKLRQIHDAYEDRYDIEHFFRFGKQKLHMADFQTPDSTTEEQWWRLTHIGYAQLWLARHLAEILPRPWERNLPAMKRKLRSPSLVQRDFARIIRQIGTPAAPPKPRGISPGRPKGTRLPKRARFKVVVKGRSPPTAAQ